MFDRQVILGVSYIQADLKTICEQLVQEGGLLVAPSGPGLAQDFPEDPSYQEALLQADYVLPDSGYMVLLWNLLHKKSKLKRISGLKFLKFFLENDFLDADSSFWIMPRLYDMEENQKWLKSKSHFVDASQSYLAPFYNRRGKLEDRPLLEILESERPKTVVINIGGGVQEKLGHYLITNLSYKPSILCTGAALAFLSGVQVSIPSWADKFYLGWLIRCIKSPRVYIPRYWKSFSLALRLLKEI